jgi:glycosyltransferase involved in cell wall biosynthesis
LPEVFAGIDFLVIPSRWYENSPLVLLNSLASHTPVIVSDVAGMTEFVEEGRNGYVFARGSVDALEGVLRAIIERPAQARALSATTDYPKTTRTMTREVLEVYESAIGRAPATGAAMSSPGARGT